MTSLPPKPTHNFFPLKFSPPTAISPDERHTLIESAAYLRAVDRHFEAGHEIEDWLAAEAEVDSRLAHVRELVGS